MTGVGFLLSCISPMCDQTEKLSLLILAAGRSTRLGQDKVWLELDGQPLVERVARRMLPMVSEVLFSTHQPQRFEALLSALPVPARTVADRYPAAGPLAGLHAGLSVARYDLMLAVAVDMPFVNPELVRYLAELTSDVDAVVPLVPNQGTGRPEAEPLHAIYRRTCLPAIEECLASGRRRVVSFLPQVRVRYVSAEEIRPLDPQFRSFTNVNTPQEWMAAQGDG
jgi:molybdopterin-guanine dinucleotide biosynthesis protein A